MAYTIRKLEVADRKQWLELWRGYQAFYKADLSSDKDALFERLLAPGPDGPYCLVAEEDGHLLGLAQYVFHLTTWGPEPRCYLNDLFTSKEARSKGIGGALIEAVDTDARKRGANQTYWMTQDFNETARRLYDKVATLTPFIKYAR